MRKFGRTKEQRELAELLKAPALFAPGAESAFLDVASGKAWLPVLPAVLKPLAFDGKTMTDILAALPRESAIFYARAPDLVQQYVTQISFVAAALINASRRIDVALRTRADYVEIVAEAEAVTAQAKKGTA